MICTWVCVCVCVCRWGGGVMNELFTRNECLFDLFTCAIFPAMGVCKYPWNKSVLYLIELHVYCFFADIAY